MVEAQADSGGTKRALRALVAAIAAGAQAVGDQIAADLTPRIRARAIGSDRVSERAVRGMSKVPGGRIRVAGTVVAGGERVPATDLFFGANWGGQARMSTQQFRPFKARDYWFFSQIRDDMDDVEDAFWGVVDDAGRKTGWL